MSKTAAPESTAVTLKDGPLNVYKHRWFFIIISLLFLLPGIWAIGANMMDPSIGAPLRLGIDFRGGTLLEYGFSKPITQADVEGIHEAFDRHGYTGSVIQIQQPRVGINKKAMEVGAAAPEAANSVLEPVKSAGAKAGTQTPAPVAAGSEPPVATTEAASGAGTTGMATVADASKIATIVSIRSKHIEGQQDLSILKDLQAQYGPITVLQKNSIGPSLAQELLLNGVLALVMAYVLIVGYLTYRFQFDFAVCAMIALVHDTIFLIGVFALFGRLFHTEVDSLFVTAILTVVGFSVHDTIVVFDRIRENNRLYFTKKVPFVTIVNMSVNQTLARSINTSLTALLTMLALYLWGGETTRDFVLAIIIGIAAGTYSSIFNASVFLAMWRTKTQSQPGAVAATA